MVPIVKIDNRGFTLIELMISLVIILIMMLGIIGMLTLSMQENIDSMLREEAIKVAEEILNEIRALPFEEVAPSGTWSDANFEAVLGYPSTDPDPNALNPPLDRGFRGFIIHYTPKVRVTYYGNLPDLKEIEVTVEWEFKGGNKSHTIRTIIRNPQDV
jgi:prepilin-type N-terminal cleavage/methylation domain-containing protein